MFALLELEELAFPFNRVRVLPKAIGVLVKLRQLCAHSFFARVCFLVATFNFVFAVVVVIVVVVVHIFSLSVVI